jgi:hypothetical protein
MKIQKFGPIQKAADMDGVFVHSCTEETLRFIPPHFWMLYICDKDLDVGYHTERKEMLNPKQAAEWLLQPEAVEWLERNAVAFPDELAEHIPGRNKTDKAFAVYDEKDPSRWLSVPVGSTFWELEPIVSGWNCFEGIPEVEDARTVYSIPGRWILVTERFHCEAGRLGHPTFELISSPKAAELLTQGGHDLPAELAHLVANPQYDSEEVEITPPGNSIPENPPNEGVPQTTERPKMSRDAANRRAMELAQADPEFVQKTQRQWAEVIGCSVGLITELPLWRKVAERTGRDRKGKRGPTRIVSLTDRLLEVVPDREAELERLIGEQQSDSEPSPLEKDPPDRFSKVRSRKQL